MLGGPLIVLSVYRINIVGIVQAPSQRLIIRARLSRISFLYRIGSGLQILSVLIFRPVVLAKVSPRGFWYWHRLLLCLDNLNYNEPDTVSP